MSRIRRSRSASTVSEGFSLMIPAIPHMANSQCRDGCCVPGYESASNDRSEKLPRQRVRKPAHPANGNSLELLDIEVTGGQYLSEPPHAHLVQPAGSLLESSRSIRLEIRAPTNQRLFREDQMRPGEHREEVAAV